MTRLTAGRKNRKKQSEFQKLWSKAERLKTKNAQFRERLDEIMQRMAAEIQPVEKETARQQIPLLKRLLALGQRKSLAQWQRRELDDWIRELLLPLQSTGSVDAEVMEDICRYDAFGMGVELDEASSAPLEDQLRGHLEQEECDTELDDEAREKDVREEVEQILNQTFGPEPPREVSADEIIDDLFQDELQQEQERLYQEYHKNRNAAREELLEEMLADSGDFSEDGDDDFFGFDFDPFGSDDSFSEKISDDMPAISNEVFKRLFRSTAGQLHPDRESDPELRKEKQTLMARLLSARKQGDVMTIVEMHQQHVGDDSALSKADEKQLIETLKLQIEELECEQEEYGFESPLHHAAFENFYFTSRKKTDQAFQQHIEAMRKMASEAESLAMRIKSIKTLKPYLEQRYEDHRFDKPLRDLAAFFESMQS